MVHAKHEHQARARELRRAGKTYDEIVEELGVSKSSVSLWVRDVPGPRRGPRDAEAVHAHMDMMRAARRANTERAREETKAAAFAEVGELTDRELMLVGAGLYWAEGTKDKPHARRERIVFVNSDPSMIRFFLRWLALFDVSREQLRCHVMIHESAEVEGAERYWADLVGIDVADLGKTVLKRHNPKTVRKNVGEAYRGCLAVYVRRSAELYRRVEGWWYGIVDAVEQGGLIPRA